MPTYSFKNTETGEEFTEVMKMAEREQYLKDNTHIKQTFNSAPAIGDSVRLGVKKADGVFQDRLKDIKKTHRGSTINTGNITNI